MSPPPARLGDRSLFPHLEARAYLNHAGISPPPLTTKSAVSDVFEDYFRLGASAFPFWNEQRQRLKGKLAAMIGGRAEDLGFIPNTTRGIIDVALCFPWKAGDRILLFEGEFPANVTPWQRAAELFGCEIVLLPLSDFAESDEPGLARLGQELARGARLVAVSAVQFKSGLRMPIRAIAERCHAHGAQVFVDAVQACGAVPIDVSAAGIDYLACGSHKWLMALEGAGLLYIRPDRVASLRPSVAGWFSHEDPVKFLFEGPGHLRYDRPIRRRADFIEGGNNNTLGLASLEASLDLLLALGVPAIFDHVNRYLDLLEVRLTERGFTSLRAREIDRRSCILSVEVPHELAGAEVQLHRELSARGVACALPDGALRFSPHWPNHLDEIPFVVQAIDESLAAIRRR